jgi:superfamily II DNA/RNA helicase
MGPGLLLMEHSGFASLLLNPKIVENLSAMGFSEPTEIQRQVVPLALSGKDVSGLSRTGTGKTAAFLLPTIHRLLELSDDQIALCLAPTRELAQQIQAEADRISAHTGLSSISVVGGMSPDDQIRALRNGARIVTGTPGRVIDLFKERALDLSRVAVLVFDEADRMFDMGFIRDMHFILDKVNPKRQILLFSATMNYSVLDMIYEYGADPQGINVSRDQVTAEKIQQILYHVADNEKAASLLAVCRKHAGAEGSIIVFVNYKERVPWVAALLEKNGIPARGLSSLLRQEKRNQIIQGFKTGKFRALVATDVASRGLDVDDVSLVVNYHLPEEAATYVHRIGRTARAGRNGIAVAVCSSEDAYNQMRVEEFLGSKIPVEWFAENEVPKDLVFPRREEAEDAEEDLQDPSSRDNRGGDRFNARDRGPARRDGRGPRDGRSGSGPRRPREGGAPMRHSRAGQAPQGPVAPVSVEVAAAAPPSVKSDVPVTPSNPSLPLSPEVNLPQGRPPRADYRSQRNDRPSRFRERGGPRQRRDGRDRGPESLAPAVTPVAQPITGNPVIYCMKTGQPKNRTDAEYQNMLKDRERSLRANGGNSRGSKKAPSALIQKISSKVSSLFGSRSKE